MAKKRKNEVKSGMTWSKFCSKGLNKPGTRVKIEGKSYLIGDINCVGGVCDDCTVFEGDSVVESYSR